ncbi:hypothetical protein [Micromonospora sp. 4G55]|nr:hypothetical protein [Micromonospora sp. 4G55]
MTGTLPRPVGPRVTDLADPAHPWRKIEFHGTAEDLERDQHEPD